MEEDADATRPPEACGDTHGRGRRDPGALARRPTTAQALAQRARIVLACATGQPDTVIASEARVNRLTVGRWRRRFLAKGAAVATQESTNLAIAAEIVYTDAARRWESPSRLRRGQNSTAGSSDACPAHPASPRHRGEEPLGGFVSAC
jgi:hypothetical protein